TARISAIHVRIPKETRTGVPVCGVGNPCIRIRVVAERPHVALAEEASPARDRKWRHDPISFCKVLYVMSHFDDFTHEFVAEHITRLHRRNVAVVEMQIGAADCRQTYLDDCVMRIENLRIRDVAYL